MKWGTSIISFGGAAILSFSMIQGCGNDATPAGSVGASCAQDGDCHGGLVCRSRICVRPAADAGTGGGDSGTNGEGGGSQDCSAANTRVAPTDGLIADFTDPDGGIEIMGGLFPYSASVSNEGAPNTTIADGALRITENAPVAAEPQYLGTFLYFQGCVDASAFSGIQFSISGSFSGCTVQVFSNDTDHQDATTGAQFASGPAGSYPPQAAITADQVSSTPQTLTVTFASQSGGSPATPIDARKLIGVFWQFTVPPASPDSGAPACAADLTIDNLAFF